jgi:putative MATE family efflux protein
MRTKLPTLFSNRELLHTILLLAWPTVVEQALQTIVQYADTAQVGQIGASASAAVGLTTTVTWLINGIFFAAGVGFLSFISQAIGAKKKELARSAAVQAILTAFVLGIGVGGTAIAISPFLPDWLGAEAVIRENASAYFMITSAPMIFRAFIVLLGCVLRAAGDTKTPMLNNGITNLLNIILNFLLINPAGTFHVGKLSIWGAGLGVKGAAIATAASYCVGGILMLLGIFKNPILSPKGEAFRPKKEILLPCLKVALPVVAERTACSFGHVVFTSLVTKLGTLAVATHSIALTAEQAFYIPGYGMQAAAATLSGNAAGEKNERKLMHTSALITLIAVSVMTVLSLLLFLFPGALMSVFTNDPAVISGGKTILRIVAVSEPLFAVLIILEGVFNGVGDTKVPFLFTVISMWGVRILFTFLCVSVFHLGLSAVWVCMVLDNVSRCLMMSVRYLKGGWKSHLSFDS